MRLKCVAIYHDIIKEYSTQVNVISKNYDLMVAASSASSSCPQASLLSLSLSRFLPIHVIISFLMIMTGSQPNETDINRCHVIWTSLMILYRGLQYFSAFTISSFDQTLSSHSASHENALIRQTLHHPKHHHEVKQRNSSHDSTVETKTEVLSTEKEVTMLTLSLSRQTFHDCHHSHFNENHERQHLYRDDDDVKERQCSSSLSSFWSSYMTIIMIINLLRFNHPLIFSLYSLCCLPSNSSWHAMRLIFLQKERQTWHDWHEHSFMNWEAKTMRGEKHKRVISNALGSHTLHWPRDKIFIPAQNFAMLVIRVTQEENTKGRIQEEKNTLRTAVRESLSSSSTTILSFFLMDLFMKPSLLSQLTKETIRCKINE